MSLGKVISSVIFFTTLLFSCQTEDDIYGNDAIIFTGNYCRTNPFPDDSFNLEFRIDENSLGYARIRSSSSFSLSDTTNVLARVKCGTKIRAMIPVELKDELYGHEPYYYAVALTNEDGKSCLGYVSKFVVIPNQWYVLDSLCNAQQKICSHQPAPDIELNGIYKGQNLLISNPTNCWGSASCIHEISVNGKFEFDTPTTRFPDPYEFTREIDFSHFFDLSPGDSVHVVIAYDPCCPPEILNPEAILP